MGKIFEMLNEKYPTAAGIAKEFGSVLKTQMALPDDPAPRAAETDTVELNATKLRELRWMDTEQVKILFANVKHVRIDNDPAATRELRWMSSDKLKAIVGDASTVVF